MSWRERGYVPDSDEEDDLELSFEAEEIGQQSGKKQDVIVEGSVGGKLDTRGSASQKRTPITHHKEETSQIYKQPSQGPGREDGVEAPRNQTPSSLALHTGSTAELRILDLSGVPDSESEDEILPPIVVEAVPQEHVPRAGGSLEDVLKKQGVASSPSRPPSVSLPFTPKRRGTYVIPSSPDSSPLSDPPSNLSTPTPSPVKRPARAAEFSIVIPPANASLYGPIGNSPTSSPDHDDFISGPLRNFRQRKPIQLNPYLIEQARYRETLKARGVKPILIRPEEPAVPQADPEEQEYQASGDEEDESQPKRRLRPDAEDSQLEGTTASEELSLANDEDEWDFPDVADLLREPTRGDVATGNIPVKRRKLAHTSSRNLHQPNKPPAVWKHPDSRDPKNSSELPRARVVTPLPGVQNDVYAFPSDGSSPVRPPQRKPLTQRSVNTPSHGSALYNISSGDDPTPRPSPTRQRNRTVSLSSNSSSSSSSSSNSASDLSIDLHRLQRRTNGVLPASWWKLDVRRQAHTDSAATRRARKSVSPMRCVHQPGIARAKISRRPRPENENIFSLITDESSDSLSDTPAIVPPSSRAKPQQPEPLGKLRSPVGSWLVDDDDIIMEDDRIDAMLPKTKKKQTTLNITRVKKTRKKGEDGRSGRTSGRQDGFRDHGKSSGRNRQSKTGEASRKRANAQSSKPRPPRLSVVDVYRHHKATASSSPPKFVKVAQRTALKRLDQGRSGPERKLFVLETETGTREVQEVLRGWREGTLDVVEYTRRKQTEQNDTLRGQRRYDEMDIGDPGGITEPPRFNHLPERSGDRHTNQKNVRKLNKPRQTTLTGIVQTTRVRTAAIDNPSQPALPKSRPARQTILKSAAIPAQVQALSGEFYYRKPAMLQRAATPLIDILRKQRPARPTGFSHPALGKFLEDDDLVVNPLALFRKERAQTKVHPLPPKPLPTLAPSSWEPHATTHNAKIPVVRVRRKNTPQRVDADVRERRQPPLEHIPIGDDEPIYIASTSSIAERIPLTGLAPYGVRYSVNFDTHPLKPGTIFNAETFIGGSGLSQALLTLAAHERSFGHRALSFTFGDQYLHWGVYRDTTSTDFEIAMEKIMDGLDRAVERRSIDDMDSQLLLSQAYSFYRFCSKYVAEILHFSDSVDVSAFAQRFIRVLTGCSTRVSIAFANITGKPDVNLPFTKLGIYSQWFILLLSYQIHRLCSGLPDELRRSLQLEKSSEVFAKSLVSRLFRCGIEVVRKCYEDQRVHSHFEKGVGSESYVVEAWVIAIYVLDRLSLPRVSSWRILNAELLAQDLPKVTDITIYERCWKTIFSLTPLFLFDSQGVVGQHPKREHQVIENWDLLKSLASAFFEHYKFNRDGVTINDYCRIIYTRTHHLITKWGWQSPEPMIATLLDFFASNSLENLRNEQDNGSPLFLQQLDKSPPLVVEESDKCFHLLLKTVAVGVRTMRNTTSLKKIRDFIFRLMPNHRRHYPKEEELRVEHLTALRNHHDLLCTIYWASPPACRPPLSALRDLVDPRTSHIQACAVSVRAWSYLIRFQLHTVEDLSHLQPLMDWFEDITTHALAQHNSCRAEAARQFTVERDKGNIEISESDLEDTIRKNQRQLEGLLLEAVRALGAAMGGVKGKIPSLMKILTPAATGALFTSFNKVSNKLVMEGLEVVGLYLTACQNTPPPTISGRTTPSQQQASMPQQASNESQDYGDWTGMEDLVEQGERKAAAEKLLAVVYEPLLRMVGSALGAENQPGDVLLVKVIDTWVRVSGFMVQQGLKSWDVYLGSYSHESWSSFRDTPQTRKFTAYYMAKLIEVCSDAYTTHKSTILSYWFQTLVERKSMIQYQHQFTGALLNRDPENPILTNLPFARSQAGRYQITMTEFEVRRVSLISTVLANMRISFDNSPQLPTTAQTQLCSDYAKMLQALMDSMRDNYLTLQTQPSNTTTATGPSTSRTDQYVTFVQTIISLLQQHTPDIHPILRFFTDSSAFPLPATDPTYVIARLKNYGLKLGARKTHKQLLAFFQTLCERAAIDGLQGYLVEQIVGALRGAEEERGMNRARSGSASTTVIDNDLPLTLRGFFLRAIFPAYLECASLPGSGGLVLANPIIGAVTEVVETIRCDIDSTDFRQVTEVVAELGSWMAAVHKTLIGAVSLNGRPWRAPVSDLVNILLWVGNGSGGPAGEKESSWPLLAIFIMVVESVIPALQVLDWLLCQPIPLYDTHDGGGEGEIEHARFLVERKKVIATVGGLIKLLLELEELSTTLNPTSLPDINLHIEHIINTSSTTTRTSLHDTPNYLTQLSSAHQSTLVNSLTHEWRSVDEASHNSFTVTRNGIRRTISHESIDRWKVVFGNKITGSHGHGLDVFYGRGVLQRVFREFGNAVERTEVWGGWESRGERRRKEVGRIEHWKASGGGAGERMRDGDGDGESLSWLGELFC